MRLPTFFITILLLSGLPTLGQADAFTATASYQVCFTPQGACETQLINDIANAKTSLQMQAYSFTSKRIATALAKAQARGVSVQIIIDKSELQGYSQIWGLLKKGIAVWLDDSVAIAHNKVIILDDQAVVTGSYNFTNAAQNNNAENLLYIHDAGLAQQYQRNWHSRQQQSKPLTLAIAKKIAKMLSTQPRHEGN